MNANETLAECSAGKAAYGGRAARAGASWVRWPGGARGLRWASRVLVGVLLMVTMSRLRALSGPETCTHLAFVVDTSEAMRDPKSGRLTPAVFQGVLTALAAHPELRAVQLFDADGNRMLTLHEGWEACVPETLLAIERALARYSATTVPNPLPGIVQALRLFPGEKEPDAKLHVCVIGDTYVPRAESILCRFDEANPTDKRGGRRAVISVMQVASPGAPREARVGSVTTFRSLMSEVAQQHGGTFHLLGTGP